VRILRGVALLLLLVAVLAEVGGRLAVESIAEQRLRDAGVAGGVEVVVGSAWWRPSVVPTLFGADLDRVAVHLRDARVYSLSVSEADYVLEGLGVAISVRQRTIGASSLDEGTVRLLADPASMARDLGYEVVVEGDRVLVGPDRDPAVLQVEGDDLVVTSAALAPEGGSTRMPVVDPAVLPCAPSVRVVDGFVELRCSGDRLPGMLGEPLGPRVRDVPDDGADVPVELHPPVTLELDAPPAGVDGRGPTGGG
jgi:hypothetical protein